MVTTAKFTVKDPVSAATHFVGFLAGIPITISLTLNGVARGSSLMTVSFLIFGISLLLLYGASTVYHTLDVSPEKTAVLRRIDHMMIFVLIAGTYTPICTILLKGFWGNILLCLVWGFAVAGVALKIFWLTAPRWLSTAIYVIMGWLVVVAFVPLKQAVSTSGLLLLIAGGVTYTLGAVIYALKWPKINLEQFGFHEIFHLFVLGGTAFHVVFMYLNVL